MAPVIQISRRSTHVGGTRAIARVRAEFAARHTALLPRFLDSALLANAHAEMRKLQFDEFADPGWLKEQRLDTGVLLNLLGFLINCPDVFRAIEAMTGCGPIGSFMPRLYRMVPGHRHYLGWHDDGIGERLVGMSVNLTDGVFDGGQFQIRDRRSKKILNTVANTGPGDAFLFRIGRAFEHRVRSVRGTIPKDTFVGWFVSKPRYADRFRDASSQPLRSVRPARGKKTSAKSS